MEKLSINSLQSLASRRVASQNHAKNLAGLKKFTEDKMPSFKKSPTDLLNSLDKLAQASKSIQPHSQM